jgi:UDP-N-acetylglucosamine acyltransferase
VIHPTAIVADGARLDPSVEVGAYAFVGSDVELKAGVRIGPHAVVHGWTTLEEQVRVWSHAVIGGEPQDWSYDGAKSFVRVGPRTVIREHVSINRGSKQGNETTVGADCMLMNSSHVAHDCKLGDHVTLAGGALLAGHVQLGERVFLGGNAAIHQFSFVGRIAMIAGLRRVPRDVPPFVTVNSDDAIDGINVVGLRRAGIDKQARRELVRVVGELRSARDPAAKILERFDPQTQQGREFRDEMLNPRRRGWMSFAARGR